MIHFVTRPRPGASSSPGTEAPWCWSRPRAPSRRCAEVRWRSPPPPGSGPGANPRRAGSRTRARPPPPASAARPAFTFVHAGREQTWSYAATWERVQRIGRGLLAHGLEPGDRVLVRLPHSPDYAFALLRRDRRRAGSDPRLAPAHARRGHVPRRRRRGARHRRHAGRCDCPGSAGLSCSRPSSRRLTAAGRSRRPTRRTPPS